MKIVLTLWQRLHMGFKVLILLFTFISGAAAAYTVLDESGLRPVLSYELAMQTQRIVNLELDRLERRLFEAEESLYNLQKDKIGDNIPQHIIKREIKLKQDIEKLKRKIEKKEQELDD